MTVTNSRAEPFAADSRASQQGLAQLPVSPSQCKASVYVLKALQELYSPTDPCRGSCRYCSATINTNCSHALEQC